MKKTFFTAVLLLVLQPLFGYHTRLNITVENRDLKITANFSLSNSSVRVVLPKRAHLSGVNSPGMASVRFFNNQNSIMIDDVLTSYGGRINIVYTLPIPGIEFSIDDWMPSPDEKGSFTAMVTSPDGHKGLFIPYRARVMDGFTLEPSDKPILCSGRFRAEDAVIGGRKYEWFSVSRSETTLSNAAVQLSNYAEKLFPLPPSVNHLVFVELPMNRDTVRITADTVFAVVNNNKKEELNRVLASLYFRTILGWKEDYAFAFSDLYRRLLDENGGLRKEDSSVIAVPRESYYRNILKSGFERSDPVQVDVADMLKNFALIHFCYYTVGPDDFLAGMKRRLALSREMPESIEQMFTNSGDARPAVRLISEKLLPLAKWIPDLILKGNVLYRNSDAIPDVSVSVDDELRETQWDGKRMITLDVTNGFITVDPYRLVPQLDFHNDKTTVGPDRKMAEEWNSVYLAAVQHRHFGGETVRSVLDIQKLDLPSVNAFGIGKGRPAYVAVVRFIAPVNGRLLEGLKDIVLTVGTNEKVHAVGDRIRF